MLNLAKDRAVYIVCGRTDLRKQIDGLRAIVETEFALDAFGKSVFLFCGRRADRIKALMWDEGKGFVLLYMRLEQGRFQWPRKPREIKILSSEQYEQLMNGQKVD